jgi:hypothetical protein
VGRNDGTDPEFVLALQVFTDSDNPMSVLFSPKAISCMVETLGGFSARQGRKLKVGTGGHPILWYDLDEFMAFVVALHAMRVGKKMNHALRGETAHGIEL